MSSYRRAMRLFSRDIRLFFLSAIATALAWDGIRTVLFNLYLLRLGYGPEFIGLVNAVGTAAFALFCLPAGALGTRWSSRRMLIAGVGLLSISFALLPLVESMPESWRDGWLVANSAVTFLGLALYLVNGLPFMMGATGIEERNYVFSFHIALIPLAAFVGSLLGGALPGLFAELLGIPAGEAAAYRFPLWLAALLLALGVVALLPTRSVDGQPETGPGVGQPQTGGDHAPISLFLAIGVVMALRFGGRAMIVTFSNIYLDEALSLSTVLIGAISAAAQVLSIPAALATPLLMGRWGNPRLIFLGTLGMALASLPLALVPNWFGAGVALVGSQALFSVTIGPLRVFSQELVTPRWRATMASSFMAGAGLAFSLTSLLGGFAIASAGYRPVFLAGIGLAAVGAVLFWVYFRVPRGELAEIEASI